MDFALELLIGGSFEFTCRNPGSGRVNGKYGSVSYKTKQNKPRPKSEWYVVEGTHEPIIDRELWDRVQALIEQRAKPFDVGTVGLFGRVSDESVS